MRIVAIDGHDGAGKTTLAKALAERVGGTYVHPFSNELGDLIAWLWERRRFEEANTTARCAVQKAIDQGHPRDGWLIFDRHWLSLFTVLPERLWGSWKPLPKTVLCWCDPETTRRRLEARGERIVDERDEYFLRRYREIANRYDVPILDTTQESVEMSMRFVRRVLHIS